jgi:hypothetical protein
MARGGTAAAAAAAPPGHVPGNLSGASPACPPARLPFPPQGNELISSQLDIRFGGARRKAGARAAAPRPPVACSLRPARARACPGLPDAARPAAPPPRRSQREPHAGVPPASGRRARAGLQGRGTGALLVRGGGGGSGSSSSSLPTSGQPGAASQQRWAAMSTGGWQQVPWPHTASHTPHRAVTPTPPPTHPTHTPHTPHTPPYPPPPQGRVVP